MQERDPVEVLFPARLFLFFGDKARMSGKDDDFFDEFGMLFFKLQRAPAPHRIADEMARLFDVLFQIYGYAREAVF